MYKYQVYSLSKITLLIRKLMTGIPDLMASLGNNIANFKKDIHSVVTAFRARGEDLGNLLPQLLKTYDYCSSYIGPFTRYIKILENQYNNGILNLESKYLMEKAAYMEITG